MIGPLWRTSQLWAKVNWSPKEEEIVKKKSWPSKLSTIYFCSLHNSVPCRNKTVSTKCTTITESRKTNFFKTGYILLFCSLVFHCNKNGKFVACLQWKNNHASGILIRYNISRRFYDISLWVPCHYARVFTFNQEILVKTIN